MDTHSAVPRADSTDTSSADLTAVHSAHAMAAPTVAQSDDQMEHYGAERWAASRARMWGAIEAATTAE